MVQNVNEDRYSAEPPGISAANKRAVGPTSVPHLQSLQEVSETTDLSYWWLRQMCSARKISFTRVGKKYFLTQAQIEAARSKRFVVIEAADEHIASRRPASHEPAQRVEGPAVDEDEPRRNEPPARREAGSRHRRAQMPRPTTRVDASKGGGLMVADVDLGPGEVGDYEDHRGLGPGEGSVYVVAFAAGLVKVGRSERPFMRLRRHVAEAERHNNPVVRAWISVPHVEFNANERALKRWVAKQGDLIHGSEYFRGITADDIIRFATTLPATPAIVRAPSAPSPAAAANRPAVPAEQPGHALKARTGPDRPEGSARSGKRRTRCVEGDEVLREIDAPEFQQVALDLFGGVA